MRYCAHAPQTGGKTVPDPGRTQLGGKIIHHPTVLYPLKRVTKFHNAIPFFLCRKYRLQQNNLFVSQAYTKNQRSTFFAPTIGSVKDRKIKGAFFPLDMEKTFIYSPHEATHSTTCSTQYIWMRTDTYFAHQIPYDTIPPGNLCVMPTAFS